MPYAVLNYNSPSEYVRLSEDYQRIMGQQADQNQRRTEQNNAMWSQSVGGAMQNGANLLVRYADQQNAQRQQIAGEQRSNSEYDRRQNAAINWQLQQTTGFGSRQEAEQYAAATGRPLNEVLQTAADQSEMQHQQRMFDQQIQQNAKAALFQPNYADQQTMQAIRTMPPQVQSAYQEAQAQEQMLRNELAMGQLSPEQYMNAMSSHPWRQTINETHLAAMTMKRPTPEDDWSQSAVTDPVTHARMYKTKNGWAEVKTESGRSAIQQSYFEQSQPVIDQLIQAKDFDGAKKLMDQASELDAARNAAWAKSRTIRVAGVDMIRDDKGQLIKLDQPRSDLTFKKAEMALKLSEQEVRVKVTGPDGSEKDTTVPKYKSEEEIRAAVDKYFGMFSDSTEETLQKVDKQGQPEPPKQTRTKNQILDEAMQARARGDMETYNRLKQEYSQLK